MLSHSKSASSRTMANSNANEKEEIRDFMCTNPKMMAIAMRTMKQISFMHIRVPLVRITKAFTHWKHLIQYERFTEERHQAILSDNGNSMENVIQTNDSLLQENKRLREELTLHSSVHYENDKFRRIIKKATITTVRVHFIRFLLAFTLFLPSIFRSPVLYVC
jgi:hypothetical protein